MANTENLNDIHRELLGALTAADGPITATELRHRVNAHRTDPLITEQVYRRLVALERRGLIRRAAVPPGRRDTSWQPTEAARRAGCGS